MVTSKELRDKSGITRIKQILLILTVALILYVIFFYIPKYNEQQQILEAKRLSYELIHANPEYIKSTEIVKVNKTVVLVVEVIDISKIHEIKAQNKDVKIKYIYIKNTQ